MNSEALNSPNGALSDEVWMRKAIALAKRAALRGEVPVGAVLVKDGKPVSWAFNERETLGSSLGHAECLAIHRANRKLGAWRLEGCTLYITLEPCLMCSGAIIQSRIPRIVYGAVDPKAGAVESLYKTLEDTRLNHRPEVRGGVLGEECGKLLKDFFRQRREDKKNAKSPIA